MHGYVKNNPWAHKPKDYFLGISKITEQNALFDFYKVKIASPAQAGLGL
jgi:hypothetical protein